MGLGMGWRLVCGQRGGWVSVQTGQREGLGVWSRGECLVRGWVSSPVEETYPLPKIASAAFGTHPNGMHSCRKSIKIITFL